MGKYAQAEPFLKRALSIREEALGRKHVDVTTRLDNLAQLYHGQAKHSEAEVLYKESWELREKVLGTEHPDVARSLENYAALLRKTNREAEALKMENRAKAIWAKHAGENLSGVKYSRESLR
jgi:tetratricopeptide (TPR) repeat protein